jgi:hypothetical protein
MLAEILKQAQKAGHSNVVLKAQSNQVKNAALQVNSMF